jgi:N-acetyl-gamma-glutamyl-phosphate reductase
MNKTKVAILGASGYSGQELIRLLLRHPRADVVCFTSRQYAGKPVADVFPRFRGQVDAVFIEPGLDKIVGDVAFLALPHGIAIGLAPGLLQKGMKVLDLSADFRLKSAAVYREFYERDHGAPELLQESVYGLPELHRDKIRGANLIACPGCYPTSIILAVTPALKRGLAKPTGIIAASLSGVSGAGRKVADEYLFTECNESARAYGIPRHRHLGEIEQELGATISFAPHLVPLNRGIISTVYMDPAPSRTNLAQPSDALAVYREFYRGEQFIRVTDALPDTKNVAMTNFCDISVRIDNRANKLIVVSAIDNLTKGAAGQAVQCMNLMCNHDEATGLL